jgi:hypothetical protein
MNLLLLLIGAFALTAGIEYVVLSLLLRDNPVSFLPGVILVNGVTNPLLNYLVLFAGQPVLPLEILVILVETLLYGVLFRIRLPRSLLFSLLMNLASFGAGVVLMRLF